MLKALLVLCGEPFMLASTILALPRPDQPSLDRCDAVFGCVFLCLCVPRECVCEDRVCVACLRPRPGWAVTAFALASGLYAAMRWQPQYA